VFVVPPATLTWQEKARYRHLCAFGKEAVKPERRIICCLLDGLQMFPPTREEAASAHWLPGVASGIRQTGFQHSNERLPSLLAALEAKWRGMGVPAAHWLAPGEHPAHTSREIATRLGVEASTDLVTWFSWHSGVDSQAPFIARYLWWAFRLPSLSEAIESTLEMRRIAKRGCSSGPGPERFRQGVLDQSYGR
jgi:hypothetical protein